MGVPLPVCSDNCGDGETIPQFLHLFVPNPLPIYWEYWFGKTYEYIGTEPDDRCIWVPLRPSPFWTLEKVSRYPTGWEFVDTRPIPGKWTWRFSLDYVGVGFVLNGWSKHFPRFAPGVPDPDKNCTSVQSLVNYVPLKLQFNARLEPLLEEKPHVHFNQRTTPCFCHNECPLQSRPFKKYFVKTLQPSALPGYEDGKLYEHKTSIADFCKWEPVEPTGGATQEDLTKENSVPAGGADHAYIWILQLALPPDAEEFSRIVPWNDDNDPFNMIDALCNIPYTLEHPTTGDQATIRPIPDWICDDDAAREWVVS